MSQSKAKNCEKLREPLILFTDVGHWLSNVTIIQAYGINVQISAAQSSVLGQLVELLSGSRRRFELWAVPVIERKQENIKKPSGVKCHIKYNNTKSKEY